MMVKSIALTILKKFNLILFFQKYDMNGRYEQQVLDLKRYEKAR